MFKPLAPPLKKHRSEPAPVSKPGTKPALAAKVASAANVVEAPCPVEEAAKAKYAKMKVTVEAMREDADRKDLAIERLTDELIRLKAETQADILRRRKELEAELSDLEKKEEAVTALAVKKVTEAEEQRRRTEAAKERMKEAQTLYDEASAQLAELQAKIRDRNEDVKEVERAIGAVAEKTAAHNRRLDELHEKRTKQKNDLATLREEAKLERQKLDIALSIEAEKEAGLESLRKKIADLRQQKKAAFGRV